MAMSNIHKYFKEHHKEVIKIKSEIFIIDGELVVPRQFISELYGVSLRQITNWSSQWLNHDYIADVAKGVKYYSLIKLFKAYDENINKTKSNATLQKRSTKGKKEEISADALEYVDKEEADRLLQIEKVRIERVKYAELSGKLIPAEDTDKAMAELGALHLAQYQNDLKILPVILENKSKQEITQILDEHYSSRVSDMNDVVRKSIDDNNISMHTMFEKIMANIEKVISFLGGK